jgi:hypothetical protein
MEFDSAVFRIVSDVDTGRFELEIAPNGSQEYRPCL